MQRERDRRRRIAGRIDRDARTLVPQVRGERQRSPMRVGRIGANHDRRGQRQRARQATNGTRPGQYGKPRRVDRRARGDVAVCARRRDGAERAQRQDRGENDKKHCSQGEIEFGSPSHVALGGDGTNPSRRALIHPP